MIDTPFSPTPDCSHITHHLIRGDDTWEVCDYDDQGEAIYISTTTRLTELPSDFIIRELSTSKDTPITINPNPDQEFELDDDDCFTYPVEMF